MKKLTHILAASSLLLLLGCSVGPDYKKPETAAPEKWVSNTEISDANSIDQNWWQNFHDPVLTKLIDKANEGNFDLKIAEARIAEARSGRESAESALLPQGDIKADAVRQGNRIAFPGGSGSGFSDLLRKPYNTFETGFDASWEADLFGRTTRNIEGASAEVEASEASRDDMRVMMLAEVARTYIDIRRAQTQIIIAQNTLDSNKHSLEIAQQRFKEGETAGLDATQAEAQMQQAETQLPYYRALLAQSEYNMDVLIGEKPGTAHGIVGQAAAIPAADEKLLLAAPAAVIANRPDIRMAERKMASATAKHGEAVAEFFPDISLTGFLGLLNTQVGDLFTAKSKSWSVGGTVLWPILSYGSLQADLDSAKAQEKEALASYQKSVIAALSDVESSVTTYTEQEKFRASLQNAVASNQKASEVAQQRYTEGLTNFLEVLDAERTLYTSQSQMADADAKASQDLIAVYKSLGGGWKPNASPATTADAK